jgi:hypothetical protein
MKGLAPRGVVRVGDQIQFDGRLHQVVALAGAAMRLVDEEGEVQIVDVGHVLAADDFAVFAPRATPAARPALPPITLLDALPSEAVELAEFWERHLVEVATGLPPGAEPGARPRPEYDPAWRSVTERIEAKAAELTAGGRPVSVRTLNRMRTNYEREGLWGLVDGRYAKYARANSLTGRVDDRVVEALAEVMAAQVDLSTGDRKRLMTQTERLVIERFGKGEVKLPSRATFYRLINALASGTNPTGSATARRQRALRPEGPFTPSLATRPGEIVQIDSTRLDIMAVLDDGVIARPELTIVVDVATRSICAALLRPAGTKGVDAAVLLARMLVPELVRPGWDAALAMSASPLPFERMLTTDTRLEQAAARPVICPETIVIDHGKVFVSSTFTAACSTLGISVQPSRIRTPTDKAIVERTFGSINSLFCQYVAGYTGSDVTRRGLDPESEAVWTLPQLQELLDEWTVAGWQSRPHDSLRNPYLPGKTLSPNEAYAIAIARAGYVPVPLSSSDYIELLPAVWRAVNDYGIRIDYRTYDAPGLGPLRRRPSGITTKDDLWEVHYDPYDLSRVWVRRSDTREWIEAAWTHQPMVRVPFADFTWRHARGLLAARGGDDTSETAVARVLADLLHRAGPAPAGSARVIARTRAAVPVQPVETLEPDVAAEGADLDEAPADEPVTPFGVFDPVAEELPHW